MPFKDDNALVGKLLLATPQMDDPRFARAVIFVCAHDSNGAMGLVINQKLLNLDMPALYAQLGIEHDHVHAMDAPVLQGGPVESQRGFILHGSHYIQKDTIRVNDQFSVTGTLEALRALGTGDGPTAFLFMLGYAGWGEGQLERELEDNAWLIIDPTAELLFHTEPDLKWDAAIATLGFNPSFLSAQAGHA